WKQPQRHKQVKACSAGACSMRQNASYVEEGTHDGKLRGARALFRCHGELFLRSKMQGVYHNVIVSLRDLYGTFTTSLTPSVILPSAKASDAVSPTSVTGVGLIARCWIHLREGDPMDLYTFLKRLPKVSLHVHLAGSVQPSTLVALARKNGVALPAYR